MWWLERGGRVNMPLGCRSDPLIAKAGVEEVQVPYWLARRLAINEWRRAASTSRRPQGRPWKAPAKKNGTFWLGRC